MKNLWLICLAVALLATRSFAEKSEVSFKAADGFVLKGGFYAAGKSGPGVLLLHQCNADRRIYDDLATMLSVAGYHVLALDFRGFGESRAGAYTNFRTQQQKIENRMPGDVDAALAFLASQPAVNSRALGVVAGSCGVNQAVHAAARRPEIRTLVLLSGATDANGEAYIKSSSNLPIFGAASEEDADAAAAIKKIVGLSPNRYSQLQMLKAAGHAASMFEKQPDLEADIVIWFRKNLAVGGYGLPPAIK